MSLRAIFISIFILLTMSFASAQTKTRILFFGDSITEAGVKEKGYISLIGIKAREKGLDNRVELIGAGISGNKVYDLYLRLETDVISKAPNVVVIYVGINDVWHKRLLGTGTDFGKFGKFYEAIIARLQSLNIRVIVCTPTVIGERTDFSNELDGDLNLYSNWIREFAAKKELPLVDLRKSFLEFNRSENKENKESGILTTDKVHLNARGNELVASEMWRVLEGLIK